MNRLLPAFALIILASCSTSEDVRVLSAPAAVGYARNTREWLMYEVKESGDDSSTVDELVASADDIGSRADQLSLAIDQAEPDGYSKDEVDLLVADAAELDRRTDEVMARWKSWSAARRNQGRQSAATP